MKRYTISLVPKAVRERANAVRRARGTALSELYLHTYLHHASVAHARAYASRMFGKPWRRALASLAWCTALGAPVLYLLHGTLDPVFFWQVFAGAGMFTLGRALLSAIDNGAPRAQE